MVKIPQLPDNCSYNANNKAIFHKKGKAFLRAVAKDVLRLEKGQYDVRSCLGGIAVAGEAILHTDTLYAQVLEGGRVMWRTCKGRKDYSGGTNCWGTMQQFYNHCMDLSVSKLI
jgi:hypothetical protein